MTNPFNWYLEMLYPELSPREFYRLLFPEGSFQVKGNYNDGKPNGIAIEVSQTKTRINKRGREVPVVRRHTVTDELDKIDELCGSRDFCLMPPIGYLGKQRVGSNGRKCYAIAIDLDHVIVGSDGQPLGLMTLLDQATQNGVGTFINQRPLPTVIVSSGTGLHLYYIFEEPLTLSFDTVEYLQDLKRKLTWKMWHDSIVDIKDDSEVQYEGIWQGFRMVGTKTKDGDTTRAFLTGKKVEPGYLEKFIPDFGRHIPDAWETHKKKRVTLDQAKVLYPSWYEERIELGLPAKGYEVKKDLYEWWLRKIRTDATVHHRYWCVNMLAAYALKCGVDFETLESDALSLVPILDAKSDSESNRFSEKDVYAALSSYDDPLAKFHKIEYIAAKTQIEMKRAKRNGRKRAVHLKKLNNDRVYNRDELGEDEYANSGRPKGSGTKKDQILTYAAEHPEASHSEIARALGVSRPTVIKWLKGVSRE